MAPRQHTTIGKIYLYRSLVDFILLYPLYSIFFADHGLSTLRISLLFIIWSLTNVITNIPLGVLADKFPRKWLLVIGSLVQAIGFLVWFIWPTFSGFTIGFILWGMSWAVVDGTFEALLYDELKANNIADQYVRIAGKTQSFALVANFASTALASLAILLGYGFITAGSTAALIAASIVALTLPSTKPYESTEKRQYLATLKRGLDEAFHNRVLLEVIVLGSVIGAIYGTLDEYVPLFFHQLHYNTSIISLIVAITILVAAFGSYIAHHYEHLGTNSFIVLLLIASVLLFGAAELRGISTIILIILFTFLIKLLNTIYDGKVQHSITGNLRATVTSVSMFGIELFSLLGYTIYGIVSRHGGNVAGFKVIGIIAGIIALTYLILTPRLLTKRVKQEI